MKTTSRLFALVLLLATVAGSGIVAAQSTTSSTAPAATSTPPTGTGRGMGMRGGPRGGQPNMAMAQIALMEARRALENAVPDKGGNREKAIKSVDQALEDVKAGIEYAKLHPEEFTGRGGRGLMGRGPRGEPPTGTAPAPASSGATS